MRPGSPPAVAVNRWFHTPHAVAESNSKARQRGRNQHEGAENNDASVSVLVAP